MKRHLWNALGGVSLGLGLLGIPLPLLPTTPFLLLSAFAFGRGSPRLHAWLLQHPRFGPSIDAWHRHGAIARASKWQASAVLLAVLMATVFVDVPAWIRLVHAGVVLAITAFIWTRPETGTRRGRNVDGDSASA